MEKSTGPTLEQMQAWEKAGEGRIYYYLADRTYGSTPIPMWIPKERVGQYFNPNGTERK